MTYDSTTRRWVSCELDEDTHRALCQLATTHGQHPSKLIEQFITDGISVAAEQEEFTGNVDVQVFAGLYEVRRRARIRSQLVQIAFEHQQNPTEDTADMLRSLCELAGVSPEEITKESTEGSLVPIVQDNGAGVASAVRWLKQVVEVGNEYPVNFITDLARDVGFSTTTIKSAKQHLGIISVRKSKGWVWQMPENENDNPKQIVQ